MRPLANGEQLGEGRKVQVRLDEAQGIVLATVLHDHAGKLVIETGQAYGNRQFTVSRAQIEGVDGPIVGVVNSSELFSAGTMNPRYFMFRLGPGESYAQWRERERLETLIGTLVRKADETARNLRIAQDAYRQLIRSYAGEEAGNAEAGDIS